MLTIEWLVEFLLFGLSDAAASANAVAQLPAFDDDGEDTGMLNGEFAAAAAAAAATAAATFAGEPGIVCVAAGDDAAPSDIIAEAELSFDEFVPDGVPGFEVVLTDFGDDTDGWTVVNET